MAKPHGMSTIPSTYHRGDDRDRLDVQQVKGFLARRWPLIVGTGLVCATIAFVFCVLATPLYVASAQVLLDPPKKQTLEKDTPGGVDSLDSSVVDSQAPLILSSRTLSKVVASEHLDQDADFNAPFRPGFLSRLISLLKPRQATQETPGVSDEIDPALTPIIGRLANVVDVARVAKSNVLTISVESRDPWKAMRLANAVAKTYVDAQVDVHVKETQQMAKLFTERLAVLGEQVRDSENAVALFRRQNGLATTADEKVTVSDQELTSLNERLTAATSETADKRAKYNQARRFAEGTGDAFTLSDVIRSPVISQLRAQQADMMRREANLSEVYGPMYPALRQIHAQRTAIDSAISDEKARLVSTLKNEYEVALAHENAIRGTMDKLSNPAATNGDVGVRLRQLERANQANKALFETFLNQAKLTQEQPGFELPDARLISPALQPLAPSFPKTSLIVSVASLAGLILGLGISAGFETFGGSVSPARGRFSWAKLLQDVPVVGEAAAMDYAERRASETYLDETDEIDKAKPSAFLRSVSSLARKLERAVERSGSVVSCAPLQSRAGCSTLVYWLARTIGTSGKRVLLIDRDDTNPAGSLSANLNVRSRNGLGDALDGTVPFDTLVLPRKTFAFLPLGRAKIGRSDDEAARRFADLLEMAKRHYDIVLIDCPPIARDGDYIRWYNIADLVVVIATPDQLSDAALDESIDNNLSVEPRFDGVIVNNLTVERNGTRITRAI